MRVNSASTPNPQPARAPQAAPAAEPAPARSNRRAADDDCVIRRPAMPADAVHVDIDAIAVPAVEKASPAPRPRRARLGPFTRLLERRPGRPDVAQIPDEVRRQFPHLERALGRVLRIEDYGVGTIRTHVADLALVPEGLLAMVRRRGLRDLHIANRAVPELDSNGGLRNQQPRGWKEGATWDTVPGAYNPSKRSVVAGAGGHGSESAVLHELGHGIGGLLGFDGHREVVAAHRRLHPGLNPYQQQGGPGGFAGRQEMFAEAFAMYLKEGHAAVAETYDTAFADFMRDVVMTTAPRPRR